MKIETRLAIISNGIFFVMSAFFAINAVFVYVQERYIWVWYYAALCVGFMLLGIWFVRHDTRLEDHRRWLLMSIGDAIWWLSESTHIGLGRFGPTVLGWKLGIKGERVE
jgi:hypothetical protein